MLKYTDRVNENFEENFNKFINGHENLEKSILSNVKDIIMQEEGISEKNFVYINFMNVSFDNFMIKVKENSEYVDDIKSFENKRKNYASEFIYDKYFKDEFKIEQ